MKSGGNNQRKSHLSSPTEVLQSLLKNSKSALGQSFTRWKLWHDWEKIVGSEIAKHAEPVHYYNGVLYLWVKSSPRMQEISFLTADIRKKVNEYTGHRWVQKVRLSLSREEILNREEVKESLGKLIDQVKS